MRLWKLALVGAVLSLFVVAGCAKPQPEPVRETPRAILGEDLRLTPGLPVYIAKAAPGEANAAAVSAFGASVDEVFREAFRPYASSVMSGKKPETRTPALAAAKKAKARYLVIPSLYKAEINSYQQSPEARLSFFYSIFDVRTGEHIYMRHMLVTTAGHSLSAAPPTLEHAAEAEVKWLFRQ